MQIYLTNNYHYFLKYFYNELAVLLEILWTQA